MLGAFFAVEPQKTGLSAPIFAPQKFRSYPLRWPNGFAIRPWEFFSAKLQDTFFRWSGFDFAETI
jgi:hypothetical protein